MQRASVNLLAGKAEVQYDPDVTGPRHIIVSVQEAGFEAHLLRGDRYMGTKSETTCILHCSHYLRSSRVRMLRLGRCYDGAGRRTPIKIQSSGNSGSSFLPAPA